MCSTSKTNELLKMGGSGRNDATSVAIPTIAAHKVKANLDAYVLIDVREASEHQQGKDPEDSLWNTHAFHIPLGQLIHNPEEDLWKRVRAHDDNKTVVLVCGTGKRATMAAQALLPSLQGTSHQLAVLQGGLVGWDDPAAVTPDFLVVLGRHDSTEKLSLALAAASAATAQHSTVVLALMGDGVNWFLRDPSRGPLEQNVLQVEHGAPFKPCAAMWKKFVEAGGLALACTTCFKHRGYDIENDFLAGVHALQMPDLIRMMGQAHGGSLQFL
jgi:rhodanese-related sulfurtransferase/predicted peroxiredoxin